MGDAAAANGLNVRNPAKAARFSFTPVVSRLGIDKARGADQQRV